MDKLGVLRSGLVAAVCLLVSAAPLHAGDAGAQMQQMVGTILLLIAIPVSILVLGPCILALQLAARVTFPTFCNKAAAIADEGKWRSLLLGMPHVAVLLLFGLALGDKSPAVACVLLGLLLLLLFFGCVAKSEALGARVLRQTGRDATSVTSILVGWPVIFLAGLIPVFGWAMLLYILLSGAGVALRALFRRNGIPDSGADQGVEEGENPEK